MKRVGEVLVGVIERFDEVASKHELRPPLRADSPIEVLLDYHLAKYVDDAATIYSQYPVRTICGMRFLDFVLERANVRVGLECDGRDFHLYEKDLWRDAVILGTGEVDAIYRFSGSAITYRAADCLFAVAASDPVMLSERGRVNLQQLLSTAMRNTQGVNGIYRLEYEDEERGRPVSDVIQRRSLDLPRLYWRWAFASATGLSDLDDIMAAAFNEMRTRP